MDADDESLVKYKEQLLGQTSDVLGNLPTIKCTHLYLSHIYALLIACEDVLYITSKFGRLRLSLCSITVAISDFCCRMIAVCGD